MTQVAVQSQENAHGEPVIIIRPSFKKICDGEPCRAAILNHILYWIARKRKQGIDYWYSTGDGIYHDLDESWGVTIVRREVNALIESGLIGEMKNPHMGIDRTKHFFFRAEQAAVFFAKCAASQICYHCIGLAKEMIHLLNAHLIHLLNALPDDEAFDTSVKCLCPKHQGHLIDLSKHLIELSKPFDRFIKAITQVSTQDSYSGEESVIPTESVNESNTDASASVVHTYETGYQDQTLLLESLLEETLVRFPDVAPSAPLTAEQMAQLGLLEHANEPEQPTATPAHDFQATILGGRLPGHQSGVSVGAAPSTDERAALWDGTTEDIGPTKSIPQPMSDSRNALPSVQPPTKETKQRGNSKNGLTIQGQHILDLYQSFKGRKSTPGKITIKAANGLVELIASDEELIGVLAEIRDNKFLNDNNVPWDLDFVYRKYERYRDLAESKKKTKQNGHNGKGGYVVNGKVVSQLPYDYCMWQGKVMLKDDAYELGWNGGFEKYN